jgi:hypothetical protein
MHKLRFTIGGLMAVIGVSAIGLAALAKPNAIWAGALPILAHALLGLSILGVVIRRQAARAWWLGWAVFEWGYLRMSSSASWVWGPLSQDLPTIRLLEYFRVRLGAAPKVAGVNGGRLDIEAAIAQIGHCFWAILAGILGATLARALFALPAAPPPGKVVVTDRATERRRGPWLRLVVMIALALALFGAVVAIWSTADARLWAGGMFLLTWGLLGMAALAALFSRERTREICIGAALFGAGYLYIAMTFTRCPRFETPPPYFITDQFLTGLRPLVPWRTPGITAADSRILEALEQPIPMRFTDQNTLGDVVACVKNARLTPSDPGIPVYVDPIGLQEAEKSLGSTVSIDLEGVPLKTTLRLCLDQLDLTYFVQGGCLQITSKEREDLIPQTDDPFLIVGHSLFALLAAAIGAVAALLISVAVRCSGGNQAEGGMPVAST